MGVVRNTFIILEEIFMFLMSKSVIHVTSTQLNNAQLITKNINKNEETNKPKSEKEEINYNVQRKEAVVWE